MIPVMDDDLVLKQLKCSELGITHFKKALLCSMNIPYMEHWGKPFPNS